MNPSWEIQSDLLKWNRSILHTARKMKRKKRNGHFPFESNQTKSKLIKTKHDGARKNNFFQSWASS